MRRVALLLRHTKYVTLGVALRGADYCAPPSEYAAELIRRTYRLEPGRVRPVHNGVPEEFLNHTWRVSPEPVDRRPILFFGRFTHSKGVDTLLQAFAAISSSVAPGLVLVGRGPHRRRYVDRIRALKLDGRIQLCDWADHDQLAGYLERSSLAVLPSREENFSLAVLSAMAVGTPLITTRVGGTGEVVVDGRNGLLCEPGDVRELRDALSRLLGNPGYAAELGLTGRESVRRSFTWEMAAQRFETLYATLTT
jgi:glycosyltransferase involved in cell wall biosynthesis